MSFLHHCPVLLSACLVSYPRGNEGHGSSDFRSLSQVFCSEIKQARVICLDFHCCVIAPVSRLCFIILLSQSCFRTSCPTSLFPTHVFAACQDFFFFFLPLSPTPPFPFLWFLGCFYMKPQPNPSWGFIIHSAASALFPGKLQLVFSLNILSKYLIAPTSQLHTWRKPLNFSLSLHCPVVCQDNLKKNGCMKWTLCTIGTQTGLCSLAEANGLNCSFIFLHSVVKRVFQRAIHSKWFRSRWNIFLKVLISLQLPLFPAFWDLKIQCSVQTLAPLFNVFLDIMSCTLNSDVSSDKVLPILN